MKKILFSFLILTVVGIGVNAQNVNIPDAMFKNYLLDNAAINTNGDKEIQVNEATAFAGTIDISSKNISDITGIEAFAALTYLNAYYNNLTTLDVSQNTALTTLLLGSNKLKAIDITKNTALKVFNCSRNMLTTIDIAQNSALENLECSGNMLSAIDVSQHMALTELYCNNNNLSAIDVTLNASLTRLICGTNNLKVLDLTQNPLLVMLTCSSNPFKTLNLTQNPALQTLSCSDNELTTLDLSQNPALSTLYCPNNLIQTIDLSQKPNIFNLRCENNALTYLNVANGMNKHFYNFDVYGNPDLECIQVDDVEWSNNNWRIHTDSTAIFSTNCGGAVGTVNQKRISNLTIFPNPASSQITIETKESIKTIEIYNIMGELMQIKSDDSFSVADLSNGVYILKIKTNNGIINRRFVKNQ